MISVLLVDGARLLGGDLEPVAVRIEGGRIAAVEPTGGAPTAGVSVVDAGGLLLAPGFIELQVNGAAAHDLTADPSSVWTVGEALVRTGVTAFLPTIVSSPPEVVALAQRALGAGPPDGYRGATPLGLHLEGPFLAPAKRGAHDAAHLRPPDAAFAAAWSAASGIRLVTLAPELPGALALVRDLTARGVVVAAGHSAATLDEGRAGIEAGIGYATHLFNAMPPLDHRAPGLAAALLADPRVTVGLILDGLHVAPAVVALAWRLAGPDRISVVTDAMAALGMPPGRYPLGDVEVTVDESGARMADGRLAGSVIALDAALRNLVAFTGCSPAQAVATVTRVPARLLGLTGQRGAVESGAVADLVLLTPGLEVAATIVGGEVVYDQREGALPWA